MKVLIDTTIILDVLCARENAVEESSRIWKCCEVNKISGYVSALSVPKLVRRLRQELPADRVEEIIDELFLIFMVVDLKAEDPKKAIRLKVRDYDQAVESACASRIKVDYIVTRNCEDYAHSKITAVRPEELLSLISS